MKKLVDRGLVIGLAFLLAAGACAEVESTAIRCVKSNSFLAPVDSPDYRKYAPDREVQMVHLALDAGFHATNNRGHRPTSFQTGP